jgi:hypothetical protein
MIRYSLVILSILFFWLLVVATTRDYMIELKNSRYGNKSLLRSDRYRYGDLYGFCYLPRFRNVPPTQVTIPLLPQTQDTCIRLVALCDSYFWSSIKNDSILNGVKDVTYIKWNASSLKETVVIDTTKPNVLLIETIERELRSKFDTSFVYNKLKIEQMERKIGVQNGIVKSEATTYSFWGKLFNSEIDKNLEFLLFDVSFWTPLKELKATLNFEFFDKTDHDVQVSKTKDFLYYFNTTDSTLSNSSFYPWTDLEVTEGVRSLNIIYDHYKKLGFDEVYFSIAPNPVSIVEPTYGTYNQLIPRIYAHPELRVPIIDIFNEFKASKVNLYRPSDTHWNPNGFYLWVNKFNQRVDSLFLTNKKLRDKCQTNLL